MDLEKEILEISVSHEYTRQCPWILKTVRNCLAEQPQPHETVQNESVISYALKMIFGMYPHTRFLPRILKNHFHRQGSMLIEYLFEPDDLVNIAEKSKQDNEGKWQTVGYDTTLPRVEWRRRPQEPHRRHVGG